jgi:hypothetical protein
MSRTLYFTWTYEDYLAVTERENNDDTAERWTEVVDLIDNKHYESVDADIRDTIQYVDERILKEDSNVATKKKYTHKSIVNHNGLV